MREKDIHKLIEEQNPEEKQAALLRLHERLGITEETKTALVKPKRTVNKRIAVWSAVVACVLCLAIVLPITLTNLAPTNRYCQAGDYEKTTIESNIKEYAQSVNKSLLYIDWYDIAEECITELYVSVKDSEDVIYIKETLINGDTGEAINLYITDTNTKVDILSKWDAVGKQIAVKKASVNYNASFVNSYATFKYNNYVYYLDFTNITDEARVLEIIGSMLPD